MYHHDSPFRYNMYHHDSPFAHVHMIDLRASQSYVHVQMDDGPYSLKLVSLHAHLIVSDFLHRLVGK